MFSLLRDAHTSCYQEAEVVKFDTRVIHHHGCSPPTCL